MLESFVALIAGFVLLAFGANAIVSVGLQTLGRRGATLGLAFSLTLVTIGSILPEASLIVGTRHLKELIDDGRIYVLPTGSGALPTTVDISERSTEPRDRVTGAFKTPVKDFGAVKDTLVGRVTNNIPVGLLIGSSLINLLLVFGIAGWRVGRPIPTTRPTLIRDAIFLVIGLGFAGLVIARPDLVLEGPSAGDGTPSRAIYDWFGLVGIGLALAYVLLAMSSSTPAEAPRPADAAAGAAAPAATPLPSVAAIPTYLYFLGGLAALWAGSRWIVEFIADHIMWLHIQLAFAHVDVFVLLALFGLALGVAIPELVAASIIARREEPDLALGTVLTATVLNLLGGLGIAILLFDGFPGLQLADGTFANPLNQFAFDWIVLVIAVIFAVSFLLSGKELSTSESVVLILLFVGYVALRVVPHEFKGCVTIAECASNWLDTAIPIGGGLEAAP